MTNSKQYYQSLKLSCVAIDVQESKCSVFLSPNRATPSKTYTDTQNISLIPHTYSQPSPVITYPYLSRAISRKSMEQRISEHSKYGGRVVLAALRANAFTRNSLQVVGRSLPHIEVKWLVIIQLVMIGWLVILSSLVSECVGLWLVGRYRS